jgi:hypothetical protein
VRRVALYGLDQVGNEIVPLLELHVDVGKRLIDPLPHGDEPVVDHDDPDHEQRNDTEDNPGGCGHGGLSPEGLVRAKLAQNRPVPIGQDGRRNNRLNRAAAKAFLSGLPRNKPA